jgi:hypothetical protein
MNRSAERILTTHAGRLARPDALRDMLAAQDEAVRTTRRRDATAVDALSAAP